jgi:hypothetical protein
MDLQKLVGAMDEMGRQTRAEYHVTLGVMVAKAEKATGVVRFADGDAPGEEMSYRGYYSDLSFDTQEEPKPAADFLAQCRKALGDTYRGYKGGDFTMDKDTPLWRAAYGSTGDAIVRAKLEDGDLVLYCLPVGRGRPMI